MRQSLALGFQRLRIASLLLILSPLFVSFTPWRPSWDDTFFLHHAVCLARGVWNVDASQMDYCLGGMFKSPLMALLLIPGGPPRGELSELSLAPFLLALATAGAVALLAWMMAIARIPWLAVLVAGAAAILCTPMWNNGVPFLIDGFFAVIVACAALLPLVEWAAPADDFWPAVRRGAFWAFLLTLGLLSKMTFAMLAAALAPAVLLASWLRSGACVTGIKLTALLVFTLPLDFMLLRYGAIYYDDAYQSSFGVLSGFFNAGFSRHSFLLYTAAQVWPMIAGVAALAMWAFWRPAEHGRLAFALWPAGAMLLYLYIASGSPNTDPRFFWLVWLTLPFCFAAAIAPECERVAASPRASVATTLFALALALPALNRLEIEPLRRSIDALARLPADRPFVAMVATDEPSFNIETMLLAQQLNWSRYGKATIGTVVYDIVHEATPEKSLRRLAEADYALLHFPPGEGAPEWTNRWAGVFEAALETSGRPLETVGAVQPITVFGVKPGT
jgi:hypothetical protein